ncbi:hypothetical protein B0T26DRAFT_702352 [Lasiosphaeria miniovina]|uniref:C2H2-type domain-containing protein n=1 Tax=Lasiosphaeria miniovina TaxID=1954250 RepID=A0AA40DZI1_9PEZI|nr:uncharacterized protein B0T26DRAFT_702352 [Lasiosphaeria miniovina]KAK0722344.1 hypothetical protein B0T26DRAFT_702352 [Lasiosphaeria miniovina]
MKRSCEPEEEELPVGVLHLAAAPLPTENDSNGIVRNTATPKTATTARNIASSNRTTALPLNPFTNNNTFEAQKALKKGEDKEVSPLSQPPMKIKELDPESITTDIGVEMRCSLPPHKEPRTFASYEEYETHYRSEHTNRCLECRKNFPSGHLLGVHIEDLHDSFIAVKRERGDHTYSCLVEGCERKCMTPQKRRMHLIDKHMYPKNYFFGMIRDGIDGRQSLLLDGGRRRRSIAPVVAAASAGGKHAASSFSQSHRPASNDVAAPAPTANDDKMEDGNETGPANDKEVRGTVKIDSSGKTEQPASDVEMDDLAGAMGSLRFIPSSIRFGRGGGKAGFAKR